MKKIFSILITMIILSISLINGCVEQEQKNDQKSEIHVGFTNEYEYKSIQQAIDNASNGTIIYVHEGTYYEILTINKSIKLIAEGPEVIIDCKNQSKIGQTIAIQINANNTQIQGFKLKKTSGTASVEGIKIQSSNNTIENNEIIGITMGIVINKQTNNNNLINNTIIGSYHGIDIEESKLNKISKNNITNTALYGLYLHLGSDSNILENNIITENDYGIRIKGSKYNNVRNNTIIENKKGLYCCCGANYNIIYNNSFIENIEWNAKENKGLMNDWFSKVYKIGNYWSDYNGEDSNLDGIGDIPYIVNDTGNIDNLPLINPI